MGNNTTRWGFAFAALVLIPSTFACNWGGNGTSPDPDGGDSDAIPRVDVSGSVVDFATGQPLVTSTTVTTAGLLPAPAVTVSGGDFVIESIAPFSVFQILSASLPDHPSTYSIAIVVEDEDLTGIETPVLSRATILAFEEEFGVPSGSNLLLGRVVDDSGSPVAGVLATAFKLNNSAPDAGPFFLDELLAPDAALAATSASGYVLFFEVEAGLAAVAATVGSGIVLEMSVAPIAQGAVTLATIQHTVGEELPLPTNVSFANDVVPIFDSDSRGCDVCHSGNGIGRDFGGVTLDASPNLIYRELTEELSPNTNTLRINTDEPAMSMLLTLPSPEDPPDGHPNSTFASPSDPDYRTILGWIVEGALQN